MEQYLLNPLSLLSIENASWSIKNLSMYEVGENFVGKQRSSYVNIHQQDYNFGIVYFQWQKLNSKYRKGWWLESFDMFYVNHVYVCATREP